MQEEEGFVVKAVEGGMVHIVFLFFLNSEMRVTSLDVYLYMQALLFVADECPHMVPRQEIYVRTRPGRGVSCCVICRSQVLGALKQQ